MNNLLLELDKHLFELSENMVGEKLLYLSQVFKHVLLKFEGQYYNNTQSTIYSTYSIDFKVGIEHFVIGIGNPFNRKELTIEFRTYGTIQLSKLNITNHFLHSFVDVFKNDFIVMDKYFPIELERFLFKYI